MTQICNRCKKEVDFLIGKYHVDRNGFSSYHTEICLDCFEEWALKYIEKKRKEELKRLKDDHSAR